ncbi:MAG: class II fumarate hydratase [Phycisphaerales bacterium JB043]
MGSTRTEKDTMGAMEVPASALYGASTQRAVLNFPVSGRPVAPQIIHAYGHLKASCAEVNRDLGLLDDERAGAIVNAGEAIARGEHDEHFPVDVFQTGSGTSTNMNANEVIANLICVARGAPIGSSKDPSYLESGGVHPNDHVNMGQSSNDTFPSALHIASACTLNQRVLPSVRRLRSLLEEKSTLWDSITKIGRTHLQDATPIRLGQEFSGYASQLEHDESRLENALEQLCELAIGGTAVGTGINTPASFGSKVCERLSSRVGMTFREADNHFEAQHARDAAVQVSGSLRTLAVSLSKIASDIRLMGCGPRCGFGELLIPSVQPGSSIMPGKVNPVICESMMMVVCRVLGNDTTVASAGLGGIGSLLDLSVAMPVMGEALLDSMDLLANTCDMFAERCVKELEPDVERCRELIEGSLAMCTSLAPVIGYDKAASIAKRAYAEGKTVREVAREEGVLSEEELERLLDADSMTRPD